MSATRNPTPAIQSRNVFHASYVGPSTTRLSNAVRWTSVTIVAQAASASGATVPRMTRPT